MLRYCSRYLPLVVSTLTATVILLAWSGTASASITDTKHHFRFLGVSAASASDRIIFSGDGQFDLALPTAWGTGSYTEFNPSVGSPPFPVLSAGVWEVKSFISFTSPGSYGFIEAGILKLSVVLFQITPSFALIPATLTVVCNIPPGAKLTGSTEGIVLMEVSKTFTQFSGGPGSSAFSTTRE